MLRFINKIIIGLVIIMAIGCAGSQKAVQTGGPGYSTWEDAPAWMSRDFIRDPDGWGLMDGFTFIGKNGSNCYALKIDTPKADGVCDYIAVLCETDNTDDRYGPGTPLTLVLGTVPCDKMEEFKDAIIQDS